MLIVHVCVVLLCVCMVTDAFSVLTYNAGILEHAEDNRAERRTKVAEGLRNVAADVVCLQEVWFSEDITKLMLDLQDVYPYSFSEHHNNGHPPPLDEIVEPACSPSPFQQFIQCLGGNQCTQYQSNAGILGCVATHCSTQLMALSQGCWSCLVTSLRRMDTLATECSGEPAPLKRKVNLSGLVVLSKHRITSATYTDFHPDYQLLLTRGYINVQVDTIESVTCTHPSAIFASYMEPLLQAAGVFDNYKAQNAFEMKQLLQLVTGSGRREILLGDFNVGPALPDNDIVEEHEENYNLLAQHLKTILLRDCTYCTKNSYINGSYANVVIDHVFYVNHTALAVQRVMDTDVLSSNGHHLSDHYGVHVIFYGDYLEDVDVSFSTVMLVFASSLFCVL